jgi:hypothetical protein
MEECIEDVKEQQLNMKKAYKQEARKIDVIQLWFSSYAESEGSLIIRKKVLETSCSAAVPTTHCKGNSVVLWRLVVMSEGL